jgi:hypothetical protein
MSTNFVLTIDSRPKFGMPIFITKKKVKLLQTQRSRKYWLLYIGSRGGSTLGRAGAAATAKVGIAPLTPLLLR